MTSNVICEREKRRKIILEGISRDLKHSEIAAQLGVNRWVIISDIRFMRNNGNLELKQAQNDKERIRINKQSPVARMRNERFLRMSGMTFKEKSFRNMIDFYKPELLKIIKSIDQNVAINNLPKSIRRTLINSGIITNRRRDREITTRTLDYLSVK